VTSVRGVRPGSESHPVDRRPVGRFYSVGVFGSANAMDASERTATGGVVSRWMLASSDGASGGRQPASSRYRLTGLGLFVLGVAAGIGAVFVPDPALQELLVGFAGAGLFGGVLAYWIRPGATVDVDPPERVYAAFAATGDALERDLGLEDRRVYVPADDAPERFAPVYLALAHSDGSIPVAGSHRPVFDRGQDDRRAARESGGGSSIHGSVVTVYPTGAALFDGYESIATGDLASDPVELGDQLTTGLVRGMDLADTADPDVDALAGEAEIDVRQPSFGGLTRFDHPVASFLGVGFALGLDAPVTVRTLRVGDHAFRVVCEWETTAL